MTSRRTLRPDERPQVVRAAIGMYLEIARRLEQDPGYALSLDPALVVAARLATDLEERRE